ncbi:MAG: hypothetical protein J0I32_04725 [Sphingobacteriales bacterium]|nr:hypothetical protein [Sphingobacteriales bacterium]OJV98464.1 MAG: hypothetical protein BGO52_11805 [Sphingobacteriales bacterium 44-61]
MFKLSLIPLFIFFVGCSDNKSHPPVGNTKMKQDSTGVKSDKSVSTALDIEPFIKETDSLQIFYYDNPYGDSVRYARFYQYTSTSDTGVIEEIVAAFQQPYEIKDQVNKCRSEGKLYLFGGEEPLKTVYFSTLSDSCRYLYFIKNGMFVYVNMPDGVKNKLAENRKMSKKP